MSVAIVGDIHGDPRPLEATAKWPGVSAVVQVGDFGLARERIPRLDVPLYWIEGNHELWREVTPLMDAGGIVEYAPGCFYVGRGATITLEGRRYLCGGGADSVDKAYQERHGRWSAREQWTEADERAMMAAEGVDIMLTHSPPQSVIDRHFDPIDLERYFDLPRTWVSPTAEAIERVWQHHGRPTLFCGHMHREVTDGPVRILDIGDVTIMPPPIQGVAA